MSSDLLLLGFIEPVSSTPPLQSLHYFCSCSGVPLNLQPVLLLLHLARCYRRTTFERSLIVVIIPGVEAAFSQLAIHALDVYTTGEQQDRIRAQFNHHQPLILRLPLFTLRRPKKKKKKKKGTYVIVSVCSIWTTTLSLSQLSFYSIIFASSSWNSPYYKSHASLHVPPSPFTTASRSKWMRERLWKSPCCSYRCSTCPIFRIAHSQEVNIILLERHSPQRHYTRHQCLLLPRLHLSNSISLQGHILVHHYQQHIQETIPRTSQPNPVIKTPLPCPTRSSPSPPQSPSPSLP